MSRPLRVIAGIIVVVALVAIVAVGYIFVRGGSGELSGAISAPTLAPETTSANTTTFSIVADESEVSFELDEDLRGQRVTVVGTTEGEEDIAGQIRVDFSNPAASEVGTIRVNLRSLRTDNDFRNRAIRGEILLSSQDEYEFGEFVPTQITGMPASVTIGEAITFQITGDLTIRGITQTVTFDTTVTPVSETQLEGTATTTVNRDQYEMTIPSVPSVANVEEEVLITIQFVATADGTA